MGALRITVQDAATLLGVAPLTVRGKIRRKEVDYGEAVPSPNKNRWSGRSERTTFTIYAGRFATYVGITLEQLEERVKKLHEISD